MTGMERLMAAAKGEKCDRIPIFCNLIDQGALELGISLQEYYSSGEKVAEGQLWMLRKYGHDNVWSLFYVGKEAELFGCRKILYANNGPPNVADFVIKTWDDIDQLKAPTDILAHPAFGEVLKCLGILKSEVGGKNPICAYLTSTMTLPVLLMGMEKWMELLFLGSAQVRDQLLAKCHEFFVREATAYREAGANLLVYSNPFGSTDTVPLRYFCEHSLPWIKKDIEAIGKEGVVYYCGTARLNQVIPTVFSHTGIGSYYLSPLDDIAEGKRILHDRGLTCAVINDIKLIDWSREQIRAEVKRILDAAMPGGRCLFGTGLMPCSIPEENIRSMLEAAREYGDSEGKAEV